LSALLVIGVQTTISGVLLSLGSRAFISVASLRLLGFGVGAAKQAEARKFIHSLVLMP